MTDGTKFDVLDPSVLAEEYYESLHGAHDGLRAAYEHEEQRGLSQDKLANRLGLNKALISRRLSGRENLTLKSLSYMATALSCKLKIDFVPYAEIRRHNFFSTSWKETAITEARRDAITKDKAFESTEPSAEKAARTRGFRSSSQSELRKVKLALAAKAS